MDSRHESVEQEKLNQLLALLNDYLSKHIDDFLQRPKLQEDIKQMADLIYACAGLKVDTKDTLAKRNLLSFDPVLFPQIDEMIAEQRDFSEAIKAIQILANKNPKHPLSQNISRVLSEHDMTPPTPRFR